MGPWRRTGRWTTVVIAAMLWAPATRSVTQPVSNAAAGDSDLSQNLFVPPERNVLQRLAKARQLLDQQRYGEAVRYLGSLLDGPEDFFFQPDEEVPTYRSLKSEAQRLIGRMPREGRELYELEYGARARQRLAEALSSGDADGLAEVSRRFFHTQSGHEATLLLGLNHLDRGRPLAGALSLQRLEADTSNARQFEPTLSFALATCWLQARMPEKARDALAALKAQAGGTPIEIAGEPVPWFVDDGEAVAWLAELIGPHSSGGQGEAESWVMFRGGPSRNLANVATAPLLNMRWRIPTTDDPVLEAKLQADRRINIDREVPILPGLHPLAVGDVVLMRTFRNLLAVDFITGKRLWEVPVDDPFETLLGSDASPSGIYNTAGIAAGVGHRVWDDATYGTMSSDGRCVFTVEGLSVAIGTRSSRRTVIVNGRPVSPPAQQPFNRLAAHDLRTGKLKWHLGGPAFPSVGHEDALPNGRSALRQAETFFLGPPLPMMGRLYVLGEVKGEIRLFALDAETGDLIWSQQLVLVEEDVLQDPLRRLAGTSPSYADGVLVCPTSNGAVVAIDLATRALLWGYRYEGDANSGRIAQLIALRTGTYPDHQPQDRWFDATAIIAGGRVLVTPLQSDSLHCLNLIDGELLWKYKRNEDLFVACVGGDNVVLVGNRQVRAVSLTETWESTEKFQRPERSGSSTRLVEVERKVVRPKPAWSNRAVALPEIPSGRGFFSGDRYYLPLSSAEVLAVDLTAGKVVQVSKSRKGSVPGNLICYKGKVISQGVDGLEVFAQLGAVREEVDRRLTAEADDPVALALRGEILLDEGKQAEAIASFRRAYDLDADPRTRGLLRDALLEGLRLQFAAHRDRAPEIEQLLDEPGQRATYLRLMATGLHAAGEWRAALDHYMKLVDLDGDHRRIEQVTDALSVRLDRWTRAQLSVLRGEAEGEAEAIDQAIESRLRAAAQAGSIDPLRRCLDLFADHPAAEEARRELVRQMKNAGRWLEVESILWRQQESSDRAVAGAAVAELAQLFLQARRPEHAAWCYHRLGKEFAEVACLDGKTGRELLDALPQDGPIRQILRRDDQWPVGKVTPKVSTISPRTNFYPQFSVPFRSGSAPFFAETTVRLDQSRRLIVSLDALGKQQWQLSAVQAGAQRGLPFDYSVTHARACGHLLVLSLGYKVLAIDTLGLSPQPEGGPTPPQNGLGQPTLLWSHDLSDPTFDMTSDSSQMALQQIGLIQGFGGPFGMGLQPAFFPGYSRAWTSGLGPVTDRYTCFLRFRDLITVDSLTGELLWVRRGLAPQSVLFGDEEVLFAAGPDQTEALVLRALDGKLLGKRKVPRFGSTTQVLPDGSTRPMPQPPGPSCIAALGRQLLVWSVGDRETTLELSDPWQQRQVWPPRKFSPDARFDMAGQEAIGVLEPGGRFVLVGLPDGRTIADVKLDRERSVSSISILRSGDQYVLVTNDSGARANPNQIIQVLPGNLSQPVFRGRVYSFDLEGAPSWPEPVEIKNQHFLLDQPGRLPVITFACAVYDRVQRGATRNQVSVLCIDKRTGRVAYPGLFPHTMSGFRVSGDPKTKTVELRLAGQVVELTFTDEPLPPPSEAGRAAGGAALRVPEVTRSLIEAVRKAIGEAASSPPATPNRPVPAEPPDEQPR